MPLFPIAFSLFLLSLRASQDVDSTVLLRKQQKTDSRDTIVIWPIKASVQKHLLKAKLLGENEESQSICLECSMTAVVRRGPLGKIERGHLVLKNALVSLLLPFNRVRDTSVIAGKFACTLLVSSVCPILPVSIRVPQQLHS